MSWIFGSLGETRDVIDCVYGVGYVIGAGKRRAKGGRPPSCDKLIVDSAVAEAVIGATVSGDIMIVSMMQES